MGLPFWCRERDKKGRAVINRTFRPHSAAVPTNHSLDGGEPDASSVEGLLRVKTLENAKQFVLILHVEADPVVFDKNNHFIRLVVDRSDLYLSSVTQARELHGVRDEIPEDQPEHGRIAVTNW
jgi:hypothetical protein